MIPPPNRQAITEGSLLAGRYEVEKALGEGSFATVYSVLDLWDDRTRVALKVLHPKLLGDVYARVRLERRELAMLLRIHQRPAPNVVRAVEPEVFWHDGLPFLVLEHIEGPTLREVLDQRHKLPIREAQSIGMGLANGVAAIHAALGVHRDIKPSNIRLQHGKQPVILDFGLTKALWRTRSTTEGTPPFLTHRYAAPEQLDRGKITPASDVYALGLILYEMLIGHVPFAGNTYHETRALRAQRTAPTFCVDSALAAEPLTRLVERCLAWDPAHRPLAAEVANALETIDSFAYAVAERRSRLARKIISTSLLALLPLSLTSDLCRVSTEHASPPIPERPQQRLRPCIPHIDECPPSNPAQ